MTSRILVGHVIEALALLSDESVHCVVTSPPYYRLRDYKIEPQVWGGEAGCAHEWGAIGPAHHPGQVPDGKAVHDENAVGQTIGSGQFCRRCGAWRGSLGLEPTLDLYLEHLVEVFRAVRRVLRADGTIWVNMGDSYASSGGHSAQGKSSARVGRANVDEQNAVRGFAGHGIGGTIKQKDLLMVPARLALALQADSWYLRSDIIWAKRAPMPESVTDRPTSAHEHIFLLSKSAKYYFDAEAVKEAAETAGQSIKMADGWDTGPGGHGTIHRAGREMGKPNNAVQASTRNLRNVWHLGPEPFPEAHFATFVSEIPRRAILAGTSERGVCPKCGAPWARMLSKSNGAAYREKAERNRGGRVDGFTVIGGGQKEWDSYVAPQTIGWRPTCGCDAGEPIPSTVCDPFLGSGTTALVADRLGRDCIGIELNPEYAEMARRRIADDGGMFAEVAAE